MMEFKGSIEKRELHPRVNMILDFEFLVQENVRLELKTTHDYFLFTFC